MSMNDPEPLSWYPWEWQKWRSNRKVLKMTVTERGIYRELLDECWCEGAIPPDLESLADIARCTVQEMTAAWPALTSSFTIREGDGWLVNDKIVRVLAAQREAHTRRVEAGRKGGYSKAHGSIARHSSSIPKHSLAIDKSRVETTLNGGAGSKEPPARLLAVKDLHGNPIADYTVDAVPPTPAQIAEFEKVKSELRGKRNA